MDKTDFPESWKDSRSDTLFKLALDYVSNGISTIPLRLDGTKAPAVPAWNTYRSRFATDEELQRWFSRPAGIALICGVQSRGLEVLDFDEDAVDTFQAWSERIPAELFARLAVIETGGLGYHVLYRCNHVSKNCKIAMSRLGRVLIESRGEGGYIIGCGSPASVHPSGRPYVQVRGPVLPEVLSISPEERKLLWKAGAALDQRTDPLAEYVALRQREFRSLDPLDGTTPWGDFDLRADWRDILAPAGWHTRDGIHWIRPGKLHGVSAKLVTSKDGCRVLTVFSANAGPLAPLPGRRSWGPFAAYARLYHGGDRRAAAKAVRNLGYGGSMHE